MLSSQHNVVMDPDELVECPFDKTHMVRAKRFQYHIRACEKNFPGHNKMTCPFNAKHLIDKPLFQDHLGTCPNRRTIETEAEYHSRVPSLNDGSYYGGNVAVPEYNTVYAVDESEDWESDLAAEPFYLYDTRDDLMRSHNSYATHSSEGSMRLPESKPQVLHMSNQDVPRTLNGFSQQNNIVKPITGYGRGSVTAKMMEERKAEMLNSMSLGRGTARQSVTTDHGSRQYRSLSEALKASTLGTQSGPIVSPSTAPAVDSYQQSKPTSNGSVSSASSAFNYNEDPLLGEQEEAPLAAVRSAGITAPRSISNQNFSPNFSPKNSSPNLQQLKNTTANTSDAKTLNQQQLPQQSYSPGSRAKFYVGAGPEQSLATSQLPYSNPPPLSTIIGSKKAASQSAVTAGGGGAAWHPLGQSSPGGSPQGRGRGRGKFGPGKSESPVPVIVQSATEMRPASYSAVTLNNVSSAGSIGRGKQHSSDPTIVGNQAGMESKKGAGGTDKPAVLRGIGRGAIRTVNVALPESHWSGPGGGSAGDDLPQAKPSNSDDELDAFQQAEEEKAKTERKIRKKLKQISNLEEKLKTGETLTPEEKTKLKTKSELLTELENLKLV